MADASVERIFSVEKARSSGSFIMGMDSAANPGSFAGNVAGTPLKGLAGYAHSAFGDYVVACKKTPEAISDLSAAEIINASKFTVYVYDDKAPDKQKFSVGTPADIVSYAAAPSDYSRILVLTYDRQPRELIVFKID
jgi:hypothetical protein